MCMECGPLIKAIDAYIQKADDGLADALGAEGYIKPKKALKYAQDIEDSMAEALLEETDYILAEAEKAVEYIKNQPNVTMEEVRDYHA